MVASPMPLLVVLLLTALRVDALPTPSSGARALRARAPVSAVTMAAKAKAKSKKATAKKKTAAPRGFGAVTAAPLPAAVQALVRDAKKLARAAREQTDDATDPRRWFQLAAAAAELEEYAEARMIMEVGLEHCGGPDDERGQPLVQAIGQMRRVGPSAEVEAAGQAVEWPGKGDESPYEPTTMRFRRYSARAWPSDCPRGTYYPTGDGAIAVSETPVLPTSECAWVVAQAERTARERWLSDHADSSNIGADMIWAKGFPDRLWLREVPGLVEWFEHRLRTRLFPMLQSLYPEAIPTADVLRCHDAFISRYDADGMASLEVHQDTTDFTFTIALNPATDYDGGGTVFPNVRPVDAPADAPYADTVVAPGCGCVASFCGRLHHGGNAITRGTRYIIPLFIYLDRNKLTDKPRGYLLREASLTLGTPTGLDLHSELLRPAPR